MKNKKILIRTGLLLYSLLWTHISGAQSVAVYGGGLSAVDITSGGYHISTEEYLYIGPGSYRVNGIWEIYAKNIVIDTAAVITGSGSIQIYNPSAIGKSASRTFIDGNAGNYQMDVNIVLNNADGLELKNITFPNDLVLNGFKNNVASSVYIGKDLNLAVNGADVWLDATAVGNLHFDSNATITNYSVDRMVITNNSIISHVIRDAGSTGFFFPVGIADGDYTPARIDGNNEYYVSVQNFADAAPIVNERSEGMDRIWHIYGGSASSVTLIHNALATDGPNYIDAFAFITRYLGAGVWSSAAVSEYTADGVHTNSDLIGLGIPALSSSDASYLTKASDAHSPLPITLINFVAYEKGNTAQLEWATASEQNNKGFEIERSQDGIDWDNIGFVKSLADNGNSNLKLEYSFVDNKPAVGQNYYRLKQLDFDGQYSYTLIRTVAFESTNMISIVPNPASEFIKISGLKGDEQIYIVDASGRLVYVQKANDLSMYITLHQLMAGNYIVKITDENGSFFNHKMIKIN